MKEKELLELNIQRMIYQIRGKSVMLDNDLAELYNVDTRTLNQAIKRNIKRFPDDFMFQLTETEFQNLRSQIVISSSVHGGRRYMPMAFTEQGVAMLSSVLRSEVAIEVNVKIMRVFVEMRRHALSIPDVRHKIDTMEQKYDSHFKVVFDALRKLLAPEPRNKRPMGFIQHMKD